MSRPLDPENADSLTLTLRITRPLADALDAELARFTAANPGVSASRATVARMALMRAFLSAGPRTSSPEAPEVPAAAAPPARPPEVRAKRVERAPRVVPAVASAPAADPRQLAIPGAANDVRVSDPAAAPRRARALAVATPENDALRARYVAALTAKRLTNEPTAKLVGCSEPTLRQWKNGVVKNLGGDKDPEGKWLASLASILDALPPPLG